MSTDRLEQVEAAGVRTRDAIIAEIRKLLKLQKEVPVVNLDGEDNLAAKIASFVAHTWAQAVVT